MGALDELAFLQTELAAGLRELLDIFPGLEGLGNYGVRRRRTAYQHRDANGVRSRWEGICPEPCTEPTPSHGEGNTYDTA